MEHATANIRTIRSLNDLLTEDAALTVGMYGVFFLYSQTLISFAALQVLTLIYVIRVFNLRHERAHLPLNNLSKWQKRFSEYLEVYHTPYQEPFSEKRRKHNLHHLAHVGHGHREVPNNAHSLLESSFISALLTSAFYHEVMFVLDILRDRKISRERIKSLLVASLMIGLTIAIAGPANFLTFFVAFRVSSTVAWFSFSYVLHIEPLYIADLGHKLPEVFKRNFERVLGQGSVTAIFHHQFHHKRPNLFYKF